MMDRRLTPANGRVAASHLKGQVNSDRFVDGELHQVTVKLTNIWPDQDGGSIDRQLVFGEQFLVLETTGKMAFGQSRRDGYVGYVPVSDLGVAGTPNYSVCARSTHIYSEPNIKSSTVMAVSFSSMFEVVKAQSQFLETTDGQFVFQPHCRRLDEPMAETASVAELFLGTPYLWGGNSCDGLDCSGLVQAALLACGIDCPADSDLQREAVGNPFGENVGFERGDLIFWKGHVAIALDDTRLIHASAHSMSVVVEDIAVVQQRIADAGDGPILDRKRL